MHKYYLAIQLSNLIKKIIQQKSWTQTQAAMVIGVTQPQISLLMNNNFRGFSERKLLECLTRLGFDINIQIKNSRQKTGEINLHILNKNYL